MTQTLYRFGIADKVTWLRFNGGDTWAGKSVTVELAMQLATFWACVRLTSQTIATLPLGVFERLSDGSRKSRPDHDLYPILHDQPNIDRTAYEFWQALVAHLLLWGNAFAEKEVSVGQVRALTLLRPDCMTVYRTRAGDLRYRYSEPSGTREYAPEEIFHVRSFSVGGDVGLSPVSFARQSLGAALAADEAAARTFGQGMRPGGFFTFRPGPGDEPGILTPEQREQAQKVLNDQFAGAANAGKSGILEGGFEWESVTIQPRDAELLLSRRWHVEEICKWFGMQPIVIGHASEGQTMWGTGVEAIMLSWYLLGLKPFLENIEQAISRCLIAPAERRKIYAEFNPEGMLRGDSAGQMKFLSSGVQNGLITRNEARARWNLHALPGADILTVQSNLLPIDKLGTVPPTPTLPEPQVPDA